MNFLEAERYLISLGNEVSAMKLGLENIRKLLAALGDPQDQYFKVQVAGTNGKGSVCAFLDAICGAAGIRRGLYTSPHLISITERVRINGVDITEDEFARLATRVRETAETLLANGEIEYRPTFFEQVTAIALLAFAEARVDLAILETGLGGRLDATTAAGAEIAAITRIDYDHQEYLGETIEEIAAEKAAIIHQGSRVVVAEQRSEVMDVILKRCSMFAVSPRLASDAAQFDDVSLGLRGRHQVENAKVAIRLAEALQDRFGITSANIIEGLENARHPGRLEYVGKYLFDGAHNVGGASALATYIREFETRRIILVFGAMRDKNVAEILTILAPLSDRIVLTEPSNSRSLSSQDLLKQLPSDISKEMTFATKNVANAIEIANDITPDDGIILVTGSLYLVGEVKNILAVERSSEK